MNKRTITSIVTYSIISLCSINIGWTATPLKHQHTAFSLQGKPINPACLALINQSQADLPFIYEININRCQTANATFDGNNNSTSFKTKDGATYQYHVIGETQNHLFVIETTRSGRGSGIFQDILLCRLQQKKLTHWDAKTNHFINIPYTALNYIGSIGGGDRFTGSFDRLSISGNRLTGKRESSQNPSNIKQNPATDIDIDLSHF